MNEHDQTTPPIIVSPASEAARAPLSGPPPKPFSWWLRKLFACNPFYLVSAALLLYGCYRVSIDAPFLNQESMRLLFNFTSVQVYEVLLVFTAIFLARRSLWYDSTLLVGLENLLVFVPFILISLGALIDPRMGQVMCAAGAAVAIARFGSLKRFFCQLNLPGRSLAMGSFLLALNVALPLLYRHFGETKIGVHIDSGPAYEMNEYTWLLILPAMLALANFLPKPAGSGDLLPQHRWLPAGLFALWVMVTGVHVYSLDFIYQFDIRSELLAPAAWVLAWTIWLEFPSSHALWARRLKGGLAMLSLLVPLFAASPEANKTFLIIAGLNVGAYLILYALESGRLARHLLGLSLLIFAAGLPGAWVHFIISGVTRGDWVACLMMTYLMLWSFISRNPRLAVLGALVLGLATGLLFRNHAGGTYWALQCSLVFVLLHSLRWDDAAHSGAKIVRTTVALAWVAATFVWMNSGEGRFWMPCVPGVLVLTIYYLAQNRFGKCNHPVIPGTAILVFLSGPGNVVAKDLMTMPAGFLAVLGSFLLFGLGTAAALTRSLWHQTGSGKD